MRSAARDPRSRLAGGGPQLPQHRSHPLRRLHVGAGNPQAFFEGGWQLSVWVIVIYTVINVVIQSVIQPKVVGDAVGLSTTLTFISLIFWGWVLGPTGMFLSIPLTMSITIALESNSDTRAVARLMRNTH